MPTCPQCGADVQTSSVFCSRCGVRLAAAGVTTGPLPVGTSLQGGRYQIIGLLGQGGMGAVYLAKDAELFGRICVIKQMRPYFASQTERRRAEGDFRREAELLVQLNHPGHPHIPEVYGYFVEGGGHYLVMKYIEGESLERRLERAGRPLPEADVVRYAAQVCEALAYMHSRRPQPVIHRDIKPANVIVDPEGRVWLVDFGLAKATMHSGARVMMAGGKTVAAGTPGYTPLEQWRLQPEPRSDVYALGATIHHLLTGLDPRDHFTTFPELDFQILKKFSTFQPLRELRPDVSPALADLVARALEAEAARRPSAAEMKKALEELLPAGDRLSRAVQRYGPSLARLIGVAVAAFVERLFGVGRGRRRRRRASPPATGSSGRSGGTGLLCLYCRGRGTLRDGRRCPLCGGTGRW